MKISIERSDEADVLKKWHGARAQIWIFDVTLKRMTLRIYRPRELEVIYVAVVGCKHIIGPFAWEDAVISIERVPSNAEYLDSCRVTDKKAGFELRCSDAKILRGSSNDFETTFDNFVDQGDSDRAHLA
ncbi:MAG: hypothetical protein ACO1QB_18735 [Verrucomicrobiales bacterium]